MIGGFKWSGAFTFLNLRRVCTESKISALYKSFLKTTDSNGMHQHGVWFEFEISFSSVLWETERFYGCQETPAFVSWLKIESSKYSEFLLEVFCSSCHTQVKNNWPEVLMAQHISAYLGKASETTWRSISFYQWGNT